MYIMKGGVNTDLVRKILDLSLVSELPQRLTNQFEWHEFAPLGFLLIQSLSPQRVLEVGTTIGDSYLSFCQAVTTCNLSTECICIPVSKAGHDAKGEPPRFKEFRTHHDALYAKFSAIDSAAKGSSRIDSEHRKFDIVHLVSPKFPDELDAMCSTWLPKLSASGVALISGPGQLEHSGMSSCLEKVSAPYCSRVLQMEHWIAILSIRPIGIAREVLLSSEDEFGRIANLFKLLGHRVLLHREATKLAGRAAVAEEGEMDAHIRYGEVNLRLDQMWVEKEELRKQLQSTYDRRVPSTGEQSSDQTYRDTPLFADAKKILVGLGQHFAGKSQWLAPPGREFWDECGRHILASMLATQQRLTFSKPSRPAVSVIVVLSNKAHLSVLCLGALLFQTGVDYELIIVDNGSSDETVEVLNLIDSATLIKNSNNLGFGPAVMQAAACAEGEFLCLLNNDALLERGSLGTAIQVFKDRPDTGAVGGKVRLADGRLQEAGCIVWRDGRVRQWGREDDPRLPKYCFRRPVDYCSAVSLVTPRSLFHQLGGLDERYVPAYYEDVDYCMKLWGAKRPVIYEPQSVVHHYEGASSPSSVGTREMILANHRRFAGRWRGALRFHLIDSPANTIRASIAAQSRSPRYLCFIGGLSDPSGLRDQGSLLQRLRSLVREGNTVTCVYAGRDNSAFARGLFSADVELRGLSSMSDGELDEYCKASDAIVIATGEEPNSQIIRIRDNYSPKIASLESVPR
jgi:GT2 family glycosyltransferase